MPEIIRPLAVLVSCSLLLAVAPAYTQTTAQTSPVPPLSPSPPTSVSPNAAASAVSTTLSAETFAKLLPLLQSVDATSSFVLPPNNYEIGDSKQILEVPKATKVTCRSSYRRQSPAVLPDLSLELKSSETVYLRVASRRIKLDGAALSNDKVTVSGAFNSLVASLVDNITAPPLANTTKLNKDSLKDICIESLIAETVKDAKGTFSDFKFTAPNGATIKVNNGKYSFPKTLDGELSVSIPGLTLTDNLGRVVELDGVSSNCLVQVRPLGSDIKIVAKELSRSFLEIIKLRGKGPEGGVTIGRASLPGATLSMTLLPNNKITNTDVKASLGLTALSVSPGTDEKLLLQSDSGLKADLHYANDGTNHQLDIDTPVRVADLWLHVKNGPASLRCKSSNNFLPGCHVRVSDKVEVRLPAGVHVEPLLNDKEATLSNDVAGKVDLRSPVGIVVDSNSKVSCSSTDAHIEFPVVCFKSKASTKKFKNVIGDIHVKEIQNDKLRLSLKATLGDFEDSNRKVLSAKNTPTVCSADVETSLDTPDRIDGAVENGALRVPFVILNRFITAYLPHALNPPLRIPLADLTSVNRLGVTGKAGDRLDLACNFSSKVRVPSSDMVHFGVLSCKLAFKAAEQAVGISGIQGAKFKPKLVNGKAPNFWDKVWGHATNIGVSLFSAFFATDFALAEITKNIDCISDIEFQELRHTSQDVIASFKGRFSFSKPNM